MASVSYPSALLLDNVNNPITPLVDIDSIYADVSTKKSESVLSKLETSYISKTDGAKIIVDGNGEINIKDGVFPTDKKVAIITDIKIGDPTIVSESIIYPSHTLQIQKVDLNTLLTRWYEDEYMRNQVGYKIYYGTNPYKPTSFNPSTQMVSFTNGSSVDVTKLKHTIDGAQYENKMYRINDYNSTNFLSTDEGLYPRRGKIYPSGEYIWFLIVPDKSAAQIVATQTLHLYGASGEDSPQEIEITAASQASGAMLFHSSSQFGIDESLNDNNVYGDGFEYNIYVKYKFQNEIKN